MSKKKPRTGSRDQQSRDKRTRIIKVRLTDAEMKVLRVAAALEDSRPAEFAREATLRRAREITEPLREQLEE